MKKCVLFGLVFALLFALCACTVTKEPAPSSGTESAGEEETGVLIFEKESMTSFAVVYPAVCANLVSGAANTLYDELSDVTRDRVYLRTDELKKGKSPDPDKEEILLGATNRPESAAALEGLGENEYVIAFNGKKLVINAKSDYGVKYATRVFLNTFVREKDALRLEEGYTLRGTYTVPESETLLSSLRRGINATPTRVNTVFRMHAIREAGFDHLRLVTNFTNYLDENGVLDDEKMKPLEDTVQLALDEGLLVILDFHNWNDLSEESPMDPADAELFVSIWEQVARRFKDYPAAVCYQFLNEPNSTHDLTSGQWNSLQMRAYRTVRAIDETRILFFSPIDYNEASNLKNLVLPKDDDNIAVDVHDYSPHTFTHQGLKDWAPDYVPYTEEVFGEFAANIETAVYYLQKTGLHAILGEFGVSRKLATVYDVQSFLSDTTALMESKNIPWTVWAFVDGWFGMYDPDAEAWFEDRMDGLMNDHRVFMADN